MAFRSCQFSVEPVVKLGGPDLKDALRQRDSKRRDSQTLEIADCVNSSFWILFHY